VQLEEIFPVPIEIIAVVSCVIEKSQLWTEVN